MPETVTPKPPWRIRIEGSEADLRDLVGCMTQGPTRILQDEGAYFLESEELNQITDPKAVPGKALELLNVVSSVARLRRSSAKPLKFSLLRWKDSDGAWRQALTATASITVYSNIIRLTGPGIFDRCIELALRNDSVRSCLNDLLGDWDFPRLRRVGETVLLDLGAGDVRRGVEEVVRRGWASEADCELFQESANFGDSRLMGAHSPLRRVAAQNPMNVIKAGEFLSDLVAKWAESKA